MQILYKSIKAYIPMGIFLLILSISGCKKLVEVSAPVTSINSLDVYNNDATAIAVLTGLYENMSGNNIANSGGPVSLSFFPSLSADELSLFVGAVEPSYVEYYLNALNPADINPDYWGTMYSNSYIYTINSAIEGLNASNGLTPAVKQQLLGEAKFMRAFCYFYLVNLYGDVPLVLTSDYKVNAVIARTPKAQVWQQIIADLKSAEGLLSTSYLDGTLQKNTDQRVRPTQWAATALLARAYLYTGDWANAAAQSSLVINNSSLFSLSSLNNVFLANSTEAVWQLQPVSNGYNSPDAQVFIIPSTGLDASNWTVYLSQQLLGSFESGDQRRVNWVDSTIVGSNTYYYAYKYKIAVLTPNVTPTEYEMVLRLGEQYLIRAEAEANGAGGGTSAAISDLNIIRSRAGLPGTTAIQSTLVAAIQHERQVELFTEWGHRWLDLKRTGTVDAVMKIATQQKGGAWDTNHQLFPIKNTELQLNHNLVQNKGY